MHNNINLSLNTAINQLPHASFEYIASAPIEKMHEHDFITRQNVSTSPKRKSLHRLAYSLACFALIFISGFEIFLQNFAVDSLITIDVNPSFEITTNRREHVLNVKALNADAKDFLADKDFHGMTVDDAIETLFLELSASPYMTTEKNTILLSVRNKDTSYSTRLEQELAEHIEKALATTPIKPHIVCQPLLSDKKSQSEAQQYHISPGKLQLAYEIKEKFPSYSIAELAAMPLEELLTLGAIKSNKSNDDFELHEPTFLTKDADDTDDLDDVDDLDSNDTDVDGTDSDDDDTDDTDDDMDIDKDDKNDSDNENHIDAVKPHNKNNAGLQKPSDKNDDDAHEQIEPPENDNDTTEQSDEAILESENDNDITEPPDEVLSEPENDNDADNSEPIESLSSEQDSPTTPSESTESAPSENHSDAKDSQLSVDNATDVSTDSGDNSSDSQSTESSDNSSDSQSTDSGDNSSDSESTEP